MDFAIEPQPASSGAQIRAATAADGDEPLDLAVATALITRPVVPELLAAWLEKARADLEASAISGLGVEPSAMVDLLGCLEASLARLTNIVLLQRFTSFQMVVSPLWRPIPASPGDAPAGAPRKFLDAYIAWERVERLISEDGPYPELGRLLGLTRANWLDAAVELAQRIERHRAELAALAGCGIADLGPLTGVQSGISDPHEGGRTAAILSFGARKLVYKPRSLDGESGWSLVAARVIREGLGLDTWQPGILCCEGYGFMEFVEHVPCTSEAAVRRCYRRYGALLAAAHALGTCDLHHENVIVHGEHPTVVDAEPLFRARLAMSSDGEERLTFERNLSLEDVDARECIAELLLLPQPVRSVLPPDDGQPHQEYEMGALCAYARQPIEDLVPCAIGSDQTQVRQLPVVAKVFPNLPLLRDWTAFPEDHVDDIVDGFEAAHRHLREDKAAYAGPGGLIDRLADVRIRLIARATMDYGNVLARSLSPEPMQSFDHRLAKIREDLRILGALRFDAVHDLGDREAVALMAVEIPRIELGASDDRAWGARLLSSPRKTAQERWPRLDDLDRDMQVACIREQLLRRHYPVAASAPSKADGEAVLRHAAAVAEMLVRAADAGPDPWTYVSHAPGLGATMTHRDRESLYDGAAGTAVALAEAGRVVDVPEWRRLAVLAMELAGSPDVPLSARRTGGLARGLGGLIYALTRVADATGDGRLLDRAVRLALDHGPALALSDPLDEILYGRSGLLLALLALHERRPGEPLRAVADVAAGELMRRARHGDRGSWWPVPMGPPIPNVSHGTSGVAMALARWARLRDDAAAAHLARRALAHDDSFWDDGERGWTDARLTGTDPIARTTWSWCNGRSGALLARKAIAEALDDPFLDDRHVCTAMAADESDAAAESSPGLCCGTPGLVDSLIEVRRLAPDAIGDQLDRVVTMMATRTPASQYSTLAPSLFTGTAGLLFGLLRAARPNQVAPLLWFG